MDSRRCERRTSPELSEGSTTVCGSSPRDWEMEERDKGVLTMALVGSRAAWFGHAAKRN
jgi:hypothetical protein